MAIKYYAGNKITGVASDTKPTSNIIDGSTFFVTDTEDLYMYDLGTTSWKIISGNTIAETLSNKTLTSPVLNTSISGTAFLDEDNFASDAADKVASQQSIKAYVASQVPGSQNVFNTIAVSGQDNVVADGATDTLTLAAAGTMTITTNASNDTITLSSSASSTTVTVTDNESTNENNLITFVADAATSTGAQGLEMDGDLHYNPSTGRLTATQLAGTLQTAAQTTITSVGALDGGSITANFGTINNGASAITTTGLISGGSLDVDDVLINGATIGHTDDTDLMTVANGLLTVAGEISVTTLDIGGTNVTTTAAELNLIDGGTARGTTAVASGDGLLINDGGTMLMTNVDTVSTYFSAHNVGGGNIVTVGALNAGSITSGFTSIDVGSGAITTTGSVTAGNLNVTGTTTTVNSTNTTIADRLIELANGAGSSTADAGIIVERGSTGDNAIMAWDESTDRFVFGTTTATGASTGDLTIAAGTVQASTFIGNLTGDVTGNTSGSSGSTTGNAATATALATARTIGGTSFDGTGNIAVALAATATILASARTIGGTSFDGSANIVPATITVADTTDTTSFVALFESATGDLAPKTDAGITYNAGTGVLTATGFAGPLTGNVTGNASGTAATVTGGTQASITSAANLVTVGTIGTGVWQGTAVAQAYIAAQAINEAKLQVSNGPTDGYLLTARSGNTGGMTWEASSSSGASESFAIAMAVAL